MINPVTYLTNLIRLVLVQIIINKYRIYGEGLYKLNFKSLSKRPRLDILRVKTNGITCGILVNSQRKDISRTTFIDFIWVNQKSYGGIGPDSESAYYQIMYDIFMRWFEDSVIRPTRSEAGFHRIAISINIRTELQIEKFRRILTLYSFDIDPALTMVDAVFKAPYRERETITNVVYSHKV